MKVSLALLAAPLLFAGCASMAGPAEGGGSENFGRPGAYVGLYALQSKEVFETPSGVDVSDSDLGAGVRVGIRVTDFFAVEGMAENVKGFEVEQGNVEADLDLLSIGVAGKLYLGPGRIQPYLLGGVGAARSDVRGFDLDEDGGFVRGGIGVDVYLTGNFAAFGEVNFNRMVGDTNDLDHIDAMAGVMFRF